MISSGKRITAVPTAVLQPDPRRASCPTTSYVSVPDRETMPIDGFLRGEYADANATSSPPDDRGDDSGAVRADQPGGTGSHHRIRSPLVAAPFCLLLSAMRLIFTLLAMKSWMSIVDRNAFIDADDRCRHPRSPMIASAARGRFENQAQFAPSFLVPRCRKTGNLLNCRGAALPAGVSPADDGGSAARGTEPREKSACR